MQITTFHCFLINRTQQSAGKPPNRLQQGVIFHQDNAPPQRAHQATQKIAQTDWQVLTHPPYSPGLAPSDFHLFVPLKESLGGIKFENIDDAVQQHVPKFLHSTDKDFYTAGFTQFVERQEGIELQGKYVEK